MKHQTDYQGRDGHLKITQGEADPEHLLDEADFLGDLGLQIARILREDDLRAVVIKDKHYVNAMSFQKGFRSDREHFQGSLGKSDTAFGKDLQSLDWRLTQAS